MSCELNIVPFTIIHKTIIMASLSQSSWLSPLHTTKTINLNNKTQPFFSTNIKPSSFKTFKISSFAVNNTKNESSLPNSSDDQETLEEPKPDRLKLAFEKAKEYKRSSQLEGSQESSKNPVRVTEDVEMAIEKVPGEEKGEKEDTLEAVRIAMEEAREYQKNKGCVGSVSTNVESEVVPEGQDGGKEEVPEAIRIAMEKAKEYKKNQGKVDDNIANEEVTGKEEVPEAVRMAMENAKEYKKNKGNIDDKSSSVESLKLTGGSNSSLGIEDMERNTGKKDELKISSIDFVGLGFAEKKSRGLPAGLVPVSDPLPEGDLPEVEILVGDASKFENTTPTENKTSSEEEKEDLYKPKVSTWGMFPRPSNISKTYGGGKTIRPGQSLETPEDRAAKEARTRQLLAAYKKKIGLNMDPKLKAECEKALDDGDSLMDVGRLKEALPYYQKVMDKLAFQTELHGRAALQWSICQDSLSRPEKARDMYEKLQSHPNAQVNKKARQFMFSFQAMEMMKVSRSRGSPRNTGYQKYFEAFVEDKENYTPGGTEAEEGALNQAIPYIIFLASPILLVLFVAASKGI